MSTDAHHVKNSLKYARNSPTRQFLSALSAVGQSPSLFHPLLSLSRVAAGTARVTTAALRMLLRLPVLLLPVAAAPVALLHPKSKYKFNME